MSKLGKYLHPAITSFHVQSIEREQFFHLIDDNRQTCCGRLLQLFLLGGGLRRLLQGVAQSAEGALGRFVQQLCEFVGIHAIGLQFGQRVADFLCQTFVNIQRAVFVWAAVAGPKNAPAPQADAFGHARLRQSWQNTGANERRFAAAAHAENQQKCAARSGARYQRVFDFADGARAAKENRRVLDIEHIQAAKGRTFVPRNWHAAAIVAADLLGQTLANQIAQMVFQRFLKSVRRIERMKSGFKRVLRITKPTVDKRIERFLLL